MDIIGEGKFSRVVDAWDRFEKRYVAIKIVRAVDRYIDSAHIEIDILSDVQKHNPSKIFPVIQYYGHFTFKGHVCIVFERCGLSLYDFLVHNRNIPYSLSNVQTFTKQLVQSLAFIHELTLVHTDLKPENILLSASEYKTVPLTAKTCANLAKSGKFTTTRVPLLSDIKLIDLGNATYNDQYHTSIISTRHYRATEVLLGALFVVCSVCA